MRIRLFLYRVALICNILFLVCLVFQRTNDIIPSQDLKGLIILLGWLVSPYLNLVLNIWAGILLMKQQSLGVPKWLLVMNLLFLFIQFFYFFILA
jgi:hypothetical protein